MCLDREPPETTEPQGNKERLASPDLRESWGCLVHLVCPVCRVLLVLPVRLDPLVNVVRG